MSRLVHCGPFWATRDSHGAVVTPGTCEVIWFGDDARRRKVQRPVIAGVAEDGFPSSVPTVAPVDLLAVWFTVKGNGDFAPESLTEARKVSDFHGVPVIAYYDGPVFTREIKRLFKREILRKGREDTIGLQFYPASPTDTVKAALARFRSNLEMAGDGWPLALIRPLYTRLDAKTGKDDWTIETVLGLQDPITAIGLTDRRVKYDLWFAWLRKSGVMDHPELAVAAQRIADQYAALAVGAA